MNQQELEFKIGENEEPATVELTEKDGEIEGRVTEQEEDPVVETEEQSASAEAPSEEELGQYGDKVKKRIDKLTARLRETQRREQAALEYAQKVQARVQELQKQYEHTDARRIEEVKSRVETQVVALKQIIKKAREEGDIDTETEAQERLTGLLMENRRIQEDEAIRTHQLNAAKQQQELLAKQSAQYQQATQQPQRRAPDPKAEEWAERNEWYGRDVAMTHAAQGIHTQLVAQEGFDPQSNEYYDELDQRLRDAFPHKFQQTEQAVPQINTRANRPVQTVAPASRSSGVNNIARRSVKLTPSQVAIAKKLGVPLEEYAKYVKE